MSLKRTRKTHNHASENGLTDRKNPPAVCFCGRALAIIDRDEETGAPVLADAAKINLNDAGHAYFSGVQSCESVWLCPVCEDKIKRKQRGQQRELAAAHLKASRNIAFVTLTLPHCPQDKLCDLWDTLLASIRAATSGRPWRRVADVAGYAGRSQAIELKWSRPTRDLRRGGWHPHAHILLFCDGDRDQTLEAANALKERFVAAARRRGYQAVPEAQNVQLCYDAQKAASYSTKGNMDNMSDLVADYVAKGDDESGLDENNRLKPLGNRSITPFEMLDHFEQGGDPAKIRDLDAAWYELVMTAPGRHALHTTKNLFKRYNISTEDKGEDVGNSVEVGQISETALEAIDDRNLTEELLARSEEAGTPEAWQEHVAPWVREIEQEEIRRRERERPRPLDPPTLSKPADAKEYFRALRGGASDAEAWRRAGG